MPKHHDDDRADDTAPVVETAQAGRGPAEQSSRDNGESDSGNPTDEQGPETEDREEPGPRSGSDDTADPDELGPDDGPDEGDDEQDGTPLVARLRREAAQRRRELRTAERERDDLAAALYRERVAALGVLADPDDLPYDADALHDPARLRQLADELVAARPHLRSRRITYRAGQGEGTAPDAVSLSALLRRGA